MNVAKNGKLGDPGIRPSKSVAERKPFLLQVRGELRHAAASFGNPLHCWSSWFPGHG
jgi:hypothetical protein